MGILSAQIVLMTCFIIFVAAIEKGEWFRQMDGELEKSNQEAAARTWASMAGEAVSGGTNLAEERTVWRNNKCLEAANWSYHRALWLLCRGPRFSVSTARYSMELTGRLSTIYWDSKLCTEDMECFGIEPELESLMRTSRDPQELEAAWTEWRDGAGPEALKVYPAFIQTQNLAALNNGYPDIGACWREELEIPNLEMVVEQLYEDIAPLHRLVHGFVRHRLQKVYQSVSDHPLLPVYPGYPDIGACWREELEIPNLEMVVEQLYEDIAPLHRLVHGFVRHRLQKLYRSVSDHPLLPAHLLGNMWSHSWHNLLDLLIDTKVNLDEGIRRKLTNITQMAKYAEQYYMSLGLPPLSDEFWKHSVITKRTGQNVSCHGTSANLYKKNDYRMLLCADLSWEDFYVIVHEMGHIHYFMSYEDKPTIYKDGANSAFQEAIGDTIMLAVETPENLYRLQIVPETTDFKDVEISLLLYQALKKIPHIAFGLVVDKWRWKVMAGDIPPESYNDEWWKLRGTYEGLRPPAPRGPSKFDAFAKFHIPDHTPYIRYFLSEFLQFQFLDIMCQLKNISYLPKDSPPLHLCDLYGFEWAGQKLRKMMSYGATLPWYRVLEDFSHGKVKNISSESILKYFAPLTAWLKEKVEKENIPIGW